MFLSYVLASLRVGLVSRLLQCIDCSYIFVPWSGSKLCWPTLRSLESHMAKILIGTVGKIKPFWPQTWSLWSSFLCWLFGQLCNATFRTSAERFHLQKPCAALDGFIQDTNTACVCRNCGFLWVVFWAVKFSANSNVVIKIWPFFFFFFTTVVFVVIFSPVVQHKGQNQHITGWEQIYSYNKQILYKKN